MADAADAFDLGYDALYERLLMGVEALPHDAPNYSAAFYLAGAFSAAVAAFFQCREPDVTPERVAASLGSMLGDAIAAQDGGGAHDVLSLTHALTAAISAWAPRTTNGQVITRGRDVLQALAAVAGDHLSTAPAEARERILAETVELIRERLAEREREPSHLRGIHFDAANGRPQ